MLRIRVKPEFSNMYPEIDPDLWYEVATTVLDRYVLGNNSMYFKSKFDVETFDPKTDPTEKKNKWQI